MNFNGQIIDATVSDLNETQVFVQYQGVTMSVDAAEFETQPAVGDELHGFAYENKSGADRFTTKLPEVGYDRYAFGTVVDVRKDLGVFIDIGLPDKDLVLSLDDLPELRKLWPAKGDRLMVSMHIDKEHRLWAKLADMNMFQAVANQAKPAMMNEDVTATVYALRLSGTHVITDDYYLGFIHPSEREQEPRLGEVVHGRVIGVRDDGTLNLSLRPRAYEEIGDDAAMILAFIDHDPSKSIPYTDKSDPDAIKMTFGISKGAFKRALGHLLKARLIVEENGVTRRADQK
ncbi:MULTISPECIES: S1-like domain-containing RNA-binding protein [unclassified Lacticaseibacillus]|uniref:S1-like domain-containing RNA-binding protein n=1 Tax=unclassified Lacticaseibacillus TaxID=2759744 RepID=UPI00194245FC|nr:MULTISPECIES: S1-like domain-containing RNA-binding protein [unclassified Lacticaseibacillus]